MTWRLMRLDAYFNSHTKWVEVDKFTTARQAINQAEKLYYGNSTPAKMRENPPDLKYQLDLTLFWMVEPLGGFRSYFTMHNQPYTAEYVVLPSSIKDVISLTLGKVAANATS